MYPAAGRRSAWRCVTGTTGTGGAANGSSSAPASAACYRAPATSHSASASYSTAASTTAPNAAAPGRAAPPYRGLLLLRSHPGPRASHRLRYSQRRVLQTCAALQPCPQSAHYYSSYSSFSSSSSSSSSFSSPSSSRASIFTANPVPSSPPPSFATPIEARALFPGLLSGRNRRLRYTHLPAIVMGSAIQTRDSVDDHRLRGKAGTEAAQAAESAAGHKGSHDHDHGHHGHGHSHGILGGHHHHHDNTFLVSKNRNDPGVRITNIGLASNLAMAATKFIAGWAFNSKSMVADGWHSLTDLASDILTLATVSWSIRSPTERFPLGFGKVESLGALGVSGMLLVGGCYMGWDSAITLYGHFNPESAHAILEHVGHGHSHSHGAAAMGIPNIHAAWVAGGTVLVKEWLYHATMKVARERRSSVLASNALHHRVDSLTGIVTLAAILGANVIDNAAWLDPVGGLLISTMVIHAGAGNMVDALCELADQSIDDDIKHSVSDEARAVIADFDPAGQTELRDVSGIKSGQNYMMDLDVSAPPDWSIQHARHMEEAIRSRVGDKVRGVRRVRVRFVSAHEPAHHKFDEFIMDKPEPEEQEDKKRS